MTHQGAKATCTTMLTLGLIWFAAAHLSAQQTPPVQPEPTPAPGVEPASPRDLDAIRRALQKLLPIPNAPQPDPRGEPSQVRPEDESSDAKRPRDAFDKLVPVDADVQTEWSRAQRQAANGNWGLVLQLIKKINDRPEDSLTVQDDGTVISLRRSAMRLLGKAPRAVLESFEKTQRGEADRRLKEALAESNLDALAEVATRYFWIEPGFQAADALATRLLDRGDAGIALTWLKLLWEAQPPLVLRVTWQRRALVVARLSGDLDFERTMVSELGKEARSDSLAKFSHQQGSSSQALSDWPMFLGSADRNGTASGSDPVGLERWRVSTTSNVPLQGAIDDLLEHLTERKTPSIPTAMPLLVNGRVVFRSFVGLEVLDLESGRSLWSLEDPLSADTMLQDGSVALARGGVNGEVFLQGNTRLRTGGALGQYLYQNSNHALLSSDGSRLFAVDDNPLISLYLTSGRMQTRGREGSINRLGANVLRAYDLETGRSLWQVGGPEFREELATQLAGSFLLGAPVPDGDDLFVIAQKDLEIRLHVLEAATGHVKWSQLLAYAELPIERDAQRRVWAIQPAVKGSVVLCPTTVGWLVAVDRTRHAVLWAQRYFDRREETKEGTDQPRLFAFAGGQTVRNLSDDIAARWAASAPLVVRNRVLVTPIESRSPEDAVRVITGNDGELIQRDSTDDALQCFDLYTGKRQWRLARDDMQYIAGVWNDVIIAVTDTGFRGLTLNGKVKWESDIPRNQFTPSGRGVIADGVLFQPTMQRTVMKIDLSNGRLVSTIDFSDRTRPLGNLLLSRGLLISHHPGEVAAFEQLAAVQERLAETRQLSPRPVESVLLEVELALAERRGAAALQLLRMLPRTFESPQQKTRFEDAYRSALLQVVMTSTEQREGFIVELDQLVRSPIHQRQVDELAIQQFLIRNQYTAAVDRLLLIARRADDTLAPRAAHPHLQVAESAWVTAQFRDLFQRLNEKERVATNRAVSDVLQEIEAAGSTARLQAVARMLDASSAVVPYAQRFVTAAVLSREYVTARQWLDVAVRLASSRDEQLELRLKAVQLCLDFHDDFNATRLLKGLSVEPAETQLPSGQSLGTRLTELHDELTLRLTHKPEVSVGKDATVRNPSRVTLQHLALQNASTPTVVLQPARRRSDFLSRFRVEMQRFEYSPVADRLTWFDSQTNQIYWSTPLRARQGDANSEADLSFKRAGTTQVVFNGGVLMGLSLPDRRIPWTLSPETSGGIDADEFDEFEFDELAVENADQALEPQEPNALATAINFQRSLPEFSKQVDRLLFANSEYVVLRAKQTLHVIDARTGEVRWTLSKFGHRNIAVTGNLSTLWIWQSGPSPAQSVETSAWAFRASDGLPLPLDDKDLVTIKATVFADDDVLVSCELAAGKRPTLKAVDHTSKRTLWEHGFEVGTQLCRVADDEVVAFTREGQLLRVDLTTGERVAAEVLPASVRLGRLSRRVVTDRDHVYLLLNAKASTEETYFDSEQESFGQLQVVPANGKLLVFDRRTLKLLWQQDTSSESLVLTDLADNPTLLLLRYESETLRFGGELKLRVVAKSTGTVLLNQPIATDQLSFSNVLWDATNNSVDLFAFERRFRLIMKP